MPAIEKIWRDLNTAPVLCDCAFQVADREVAACIVKDLVGRLLH